MNAVSNMEESSAHKLRVATYMPASDRALLKVAVSAAIEAVTGGGNSRVFESLEEIDLNESEAPYYPLIMQTAKLVSQRLAEKRDEVEPHCVVVVAICAYEIINGTHMPNTEWCVGEVIDAGLVRNANAPALLFHNSFNRMAMRFDFSQLENSRKG